MGEIIRQTFNLYNTVGLVDKDKNIYFVPHQADIYAKVTASRTKVCDCYYELFNTVSPFSSKYQNTEISQWSPEDRELLIDGIIDDFRQSRGQGLALNYLIMNRAIYEVEGETETLVSNYYYAMFIDSVEQRGQRSVKLNLTPDYFTNFYYLNNNDILTSTYDPFNPVMKNCFVERQHYDRFVRSNTFPRNYYFTNLRKILGSEESFKYKYQYKNIRYFLPLGVDITFSDLDSLYSRLKEISSKQEFLNFMASSSATEDTKNIIAQLFISYLNILLKEDILRPIAVRYDTVKQYCKPAYKVVKGVNIPYIHCVMPFVTIPKGFENINPEWIKLTLNGYFEGAFEDERASKLYDFVGDENYNVGRLLSYLESIGASQYIMTTFISKYSPLFYECYRGIHNETNNIRINFNINFKFDDYVQFTTILGEPPYVNPCNKARLIKHSLISFLPDSYVDGSGLDSKDVVDTSKGLYKDSTTSLAQYTKGQFVYDSGYLTLESDVEYNTKDGNDHNTVYEPRPYSRFVFVLGSYNMPESLVKFDFYVPNLRRYVDPIVESDPYCFFSISINETEQILTNMKMLEYYETNKQYCVKITPIVSYNDSYKTGLIPSYYINSSWNRYYSEALISVNSLEIPVLNESWTSYYAINKAQMKNQYAVQHNNFASGMVQGALSTVGDMSVKAIEGASKGGGKGALIGAVEGLIKGGINLGNTAIANRFQVENIELTQKAKMSDMGAKPDTVRFAGSDIIYDLIQNERGFYLNQYRIDEVSYNSICKYLERFGYLVNVFDSLNPFNRIGLNYIKLSSFDFVEDEFVLSQEQMEAISKIFEEGVTLLHDHDYLHNLGEVIDNVNYHNYELSLA